MGLNFTIMTTFQNNLFDFILLALFAYYGIIPFLKEAYPNELESFLNYFNSIFNKKK